MRRMVILCGIVVVATLVVRAKQDPNSTYLCGDTASGVYMSKSPCPAPKVVVTPQPTWVQDPSAGHYDCPNGWTAYSRGEPYKPNFGVTFTDGLNGGALTDAKGHLMNQRPESGICVKDK